MLNSKTHDEVPGQQEQPEETHMDAHGEEAGVEAKAMEEEIKTQEDEVPAAGQEQAHQVPVHQGQPEI